MFHLVDRASYEVESLIERLDYMMKDFDYLYDDLDGLILEIENQKLLGSLNHNLNEENLDGECLRSLEDNNKASNITLTVKKIKLKKKMKKENQKKLQLNSKVPHKKHLLFTPAKISFSEMINDPKFKKVYRKMSIKEKVNFLFPDDNQTTKEEGESFWESKKVKRFLSPRRMEVLAILEAAELRASVDPSDIN